MIIVVVIVITVVIVIVVVIASVLVLVFVIVIVIVVIVNTIITLLLPLLCCYLLILVILSLCGRYLSQFRPPKDAKSTHETNKMPRAPGGPASSPREQLSLSSRPPRTPTVWYPSPVLGILLVYMSPREWWGSRQWGSIWLLGPSLVSLHWLSSAWLFGLSLLVSP